MVFIVKDLLVSVLRPGDGSKCHNTICFIPEGEPPVSKASLLALKSNVERVLAEIDSGEKTPDEELLPRTLAEVEMLEKDFHHAHVELNRIKTEILNNESF